MHYPEALQDLIDVFNRFPGVGPKTAQRLAFYLISLSEDEVENMARVMVKAKRKLRYCSCCFSFTDRDLCSLCTDPRREGSRQICVVQHPRDVLVMEKTGSFRGRYHVLHGALSPVEGIGPEELNIPKLLNRVKEEGIKEVIIATNPKVEGDATASYLSRQLKPLGVRVTRIAFGLPVGGDLEYADELTLGRALEGRVELE